MTVTCWTRFQLSGVNVTAPLTAASVGVALVGVTTTSDAGRLVSRTGYVLLLVRATVKDTVPDDCPLTSTPAVSLSVIVTVALSLPAAAASQPGTSVAMVTVNVSSSSSTESSTSGMSTWRVVASAGTVTGEVKLPTSSESALPVPVVE